MYIALEGIDTCGKTTQIDILKEKLSDFFFTKEPGSTKFGQYLRKMVLDTKLENRKSEMFLFLADRAYHNENILKKYDKIVSDRSLISGIAYSYISLKLDLDFLISLNLFTIDNNLPNKLIFLYLKEEDLKKRISKKNLDNIENRGIKYLLDIQECMKNLIKKLEIPHIDIDASIEQKSINEKIIAFIRS